MVNDNKPIWKDYPLYCGNGDYVIEELVNGTWQTRKRFHVLRTPYGGGEVAANDMLCADLKTGYPETTGVTTHSAAYRRYRCQTGSTASQTQVFNFCQDWSYDEWDGEARTLSAPINGHADMRQRLFRSRFGETEEEIEIKTLIRPQFSFDYSSDVSASNTAGYLTVTANEDYTIYCGSSWIQNLNTGGTEGEQTFYFYIEPYTGYTDRSTVIEVTFQGYDGNYETVELPLVQRAIVPFFNIYPVHQSVDYTSGTTVFVANTNVPFNVSENASWLELQGITQAGYQAYNVTFNYSANAGDSRQAIISFTYQVDATGGTASVVAVIGQKETKQESNEIWYTSTYSDVITPQRTGSTYFGASIVSNTYYPNRGYGEIVFDGDVTSIGDHAFYSITPLRSIIIPDKVTLIAVSAFQECENLKSVIIGSSVETIGYNAFYYCTKLSALTIGTSVKIIGQNAFGLCTSLPSIIIPDSVTTIMRSAFAECSSLSSVTIGSGVTTIGVYAFGGCTRLPSITIPGSVISIGQQAFYSCIRLSSITIPDSVTTIGDSAFEQCRALSSITIPDSVTTIGSKTFSGCTALSSITYNSTMTQWTSITKGTNWNYNVPATVVHCTDGDTPI